MTKVFISYRREDSKKDAGRIYDRFVNAFGRNNIFKDVDSIPLGSDFRGELIEAVSQCNVLLAIIGQKWLPAADQDGKRRLDNPDDFVRIEIETALRRDDCLVIPVMVDNASIPGANQLPTSIRELTFRNAITIHDDPDFHRDLDRLIDSIRSTFMLDDITTDIHTAPPDQPKDSSRAHQEQSRQSHQPRLIVEPPAIERPLNLSFDGAEDNDGMPMGWFNSLGQVDNVSTKYRIRVEPREGGTGGSCVKFSKQHAEPHEFGSLMQLCPASYLAGKTIRFAGELKSEDVEGWAGLWLRADGATKPMIFFDNMHRNPVRGTQPWKAYYLDALLPIETAWLNYGIVLSGSGTLWADNLSLLVWEDNGWRPI